MSSQSSSTDYILFLKSVYKYLYEIGGPILICIGSVSCILSLIVFSQKNLRKNPCTMYLLAFNIINLIMLYTSLLPATISLGYGISPSLYNLPYCRCYLYMAILVDVLSPSYLILASIDRMLITSPNTETRRRSTRRLAYISIIGVTVFWILFHSHILFLANITQVAPNSFSCYYQSGAELVFISYYSLVIKAFLFPLLMIIFALLVVRNIRKVRHVAIVPVLTATGTTIRNDLPTITVSRSKDRQLFLMLFIDIIVYIIFSVMLSAVHVNEQITQYNVKTPVQTQFGLFLRFIAVFLNYISSCIGCYTNFLISKTFRMEIKKIIFCR